MKYTRLFDIKYKDGKIGPFEIVLNLDSFECNKNIPVGPHHLNTKVAKAIKEVTGLEVVSCRFDTNYISVSS